MRPVAALKRVVQGTDTAAQLLAEVRAGVANQSSLINSKMEELIGVCSALVTLQQEQIRMMADIAYQLAMNQEDHFTGTPHSGDLPNDFKRVMQDMPLLIDEKTYNTSHPAYHAGRVRNYPGQIFNQDASCNNVIYQALQPMLDVKKQIPDAAWAPILAEMLEEAKTVPHAEEVFDRKALIEEYMDRLSKQYQAQYVPGWVNMEDALFLYWLVRKLKPRTIVQTGVCNGLSSAFMMLALAKNGPEGTLHAIDMPMVFNPNDPKWTVKDQIYGFVIPEGKTSGSLVPDAYRDRFFVQAGDAKKLLPPLVDKLGKYEFFYHDSDHSYNHMAFEFKEAKRHLAPGGVVVADDIAWNISLWEFADKHKAPAYNYKGAVGVACF